MPAEPTGALPLQDLTAADARAFERLKAKLLEHAGFACDAYKDGCLRRRIGVRMRVSRVETVDEYLELLDRHPDEMQRLLAAITINVSKFFRNRPVWEALRQCVLPTLLERGGRRVRVWSAGCAAGEEPYTLAMVVQGLAEERAEPGLPRQVSILATDVDADALERARVAEYGELAFADTAADERSRWFEGGPPFRLREPIRSGVRFRMHDLLRDSFPTQQHLIICRNVLIYFDRPAQEKVLAGFHEALSPGGVLVLGQVETLIGPAAALFHGVLPRERIFQRV